MRGGGEIAHDLFVAIRAFLHPDKLRARNTGRSHYRAIAIERAAGKQSKREAVCSRAQPEQSQAVSVDPLRPFGFPQHLGVLKEIGPGRQPLFVTNRLPNSCGSRGWKGRNPSRVKDKAT